MHSTALQNQRTHSILGRSVATLRTYPLAMQAAAANRASFGMQLSFMVANDAIWLIFWVLVFGHAETIRGWQLDEFFVLFGISTFAAGVAFGAFGGLRDTAKVLASGEIDALLTQPSPVYLRMLVRRVDVPMLGDIIFGMAMFALSGHGTSVSHWVLFLGTAMCAGVMMSAFIAAAHSLTFLLGGKPQVASLASNAALVFTMYPISIFGGALKLILFTVVPTALITAIPAQMVLHFSYGKLLIVVLSMLGLSLIGVLAYSGGLRHYRRHSL